MTRNVKARKAASGTAVSASGREPADAGKSSGKGKTVYVKKRLFTGTQYFDYQLVFYMVILLAFGMVMLYSASSYTASVQYGDAAYWMKRQMIFAAGGFLLMLIFSRINYHIWLKLSRLIYIIAFAACALVLVIGTSVNGQSRWFRIGSIQFQPSEIAKIAVILFFADYYFKHASKMDNGKRLIRATIIVAFMLVPILRANLSTAIIIFGIWLIMTMVASRNWKMIAAIVVFLGIAAVILMKIQSASSGNSYRSGRLKIWLHPEKYEKGYQTLQGLYAIGSGGVFGKGLGEGMQKQFVPEAQNDMIFALICEELGIFGAVILVILFILLMYRLYFIAMNAADFSGSLIVIGIMAQIGIQVALNIAVVTNTIPNTGITLPFISYGGTALVILMGEMGIALNVSRSINFYA